MNEKKLHVACVVHYGWHSVEDLCGDWLQLSLLDQCLFLTGASLEQCFLQFLQCTLFALVNTCLKKPPKKKIYLLTNQGIVASVHYVYPKVIQKSF